MANRKKNSVPIPKTEPRYLNVHEAASYMGCTVWCVRNLAWGLKVPHVKLGKRVVFDRTDLDLYLESQKVQAA